MATVKAEHTAVNALRDYLLRTLPAKCTSINSGRAAVLKAPYAGPYTIPSGGTLRLGATSGSETTVTLTSGSRTAAQIAAEINVSGLTASADTQGRLLVTSSTAPTSGTPSVVSLGSDSTSTAALFGWDAGGEEAIREAIAAPTAQGIRDGDHSILDLRRGFAIVIADKKSTDTNRNIRYDERDVAMKLNVYVPVPGGQVNEYSEHAEQCVRAVREVIFEDRTLDAVVMMTDVMDVTIFGPAFRFDAGGVSPLLARADMNVRVRVFERSGES